METLAPNSPELLCEEILADARRRSEEILRGAHHDADALLARAAEQADRVRQETLGAARAEAARRRDLVLAGVPVEAGRVRAARQEALLESIRQEARRLLQARQGYPRRETLVSLAVEAISRMPGSAFVVKLPASDGMPAQGMAEEIACRTRRSPLTIAIVADPAQTEEGVIVEDADGRQVWDNRLLSRLDRLWPDLRREIAVQASLVEPGPEAGGDP